MSKIGILIVEDEAVVAADLSLKLQRLGYKVVGSTAAGKEAIELVVRLDPQLVLMDIWLDGPMDGIQAAKEIRRQKDVPVVFLTAHSDPATLGRAKLTGPLGYILKPFEDRDLATQIELALYKHQTDRQLRAHQEDLESEVKARTAEIEEQNRQLAELNALIKKTTRHSIEAMENDRKAMSKDVHDSIGSSLSAVKIMLEQLTSLSDAFSKEESALMDKIVGYLSDTIREAKRISHLMRPMALDDFGLGAAISETIRRFREFYPGIAVDFKNEVAQNGISEGIKTVLYRVVQEALENIGRHSGADHAEIELTESADRLFLTVRDNGCGFDMKKGAEEEWMLESFGIHSMKTRIELCNGTFQLESEPGRGTQVTASFPKVAV